MVVMCRKDPGRPECVCEKQVKDFVPDYPAGRGWMGLVRPIEG